jgi:replicative DNA helicase
VPTDFLNLDEMTAGFQPGNLIVIAGHPSMGKTALAVNIAQFATVHSSKNAAADFLSGDEQRGSVTRMLCSESRISANRIRPGHLVPDDFPKLMNGASRLNSGPIFIDDTSSISALELRAKARRIKAIDAGVSRGAHGFLTR